MSKKIKRFTDVGIDEYPLVKTITEDRDGEYVLFSDYERLTAELAQVRKELGEAELNTEEQANIAVRFLRRAEAAESKNLQLAAQMAVMKIKLEQAINRLNAHEEPEMSADLERDILANLPAEAGKLLALLEAAKEENELHDVNESYRGKVCDCRLCQAYRDLRGDK